MNCKFFFKNYLLSGQAEVPGSSEKSGQSQKSSFTWLSGIQTFEENSNWITSSLHNTQLFTTLFLFISFFPNSTAVKMQQWKLLLILKNSIMSCCWSVSQPLCAGNPCILHLCNNTISINLSIQAGGGNCCFTQS